jgi:non-homologous end joining protein Ku
MLGTTLRYDYEIRDEKDVFAGVPSVHVGKDIVKLAAHILATKATSFDQHKFKDEYESALKKLARRKAEGKTIEEPRPTQKPSNVINLMDALRQSLGSKGAVREGRTRHRAARGRSRKAA